MLRATTLQDLPRVAACHRLAFPGSLSTHLGHRYVVKMLSWYLQDERKFLFHYENKDEVVGYCGGIFHDGQSTETSASGMLQAAFQEALWGVVRKPWLLLHPELLRKWPFVLKNLKRRLFGVSRKRFARWQNTLARQEPFVGLIIIGVTPAGRGKGVGGRLLAEFEKQARQYTVSLLRLSVRADNQAAINLYKKHGWVVVEKNNISVTMSKKL